MNLNAIAGAAIQGINADTIALIRKSTGSTTAASGKKTPTYDDYPGVPIQVQALDNRDLRQVDNLNIQGEVRAVYINGPQWAALIRADQRGGDLIIIGDEIWLFVKMLESWDTHIKAAIVRQQPAAS